MPNIKVNKEMFIRKFLKPISLISDIASIDIYKDRVECCTYSVDKVKQTIVCLIKFSGISLSNNSDCEKYTLNLSSVNRLIQFFNLLDEDDVDLIFSEQYIQYISGAVNFKYYLLSSSALPKEIMNKQAIASIPIDMSFNICKDKVKYLIKLSSITSAKMSDSEQAKIYLYTKSNQVYGELNDKEIPNLDCADVLLSDMFTGTELPIPIPMSFSIFKLFSSMESDFIKIEINTKKGIICFTIEDLNGSQLYLTSARVK